MNKASSCSLVQKKGSTSGLIKLLLHDIHVVYPGVARNKEIIARNIECNNKYFAQAHTQKKKKNSGPKDPA
jgi:hypothetical protein